MFGITRNVWIPNSLAAGQATMSITKYRFLYCSPQNLPFTTRSADFYELLFKICLHVSRNLSSCSNQVPNTSNNRPQEIITHVFGLMPYLP